jgi:hypothetical protein
VALGFSACNRGPNPADEVDRALADGKLEKSNLKKMIDGDTALREREINFDVVNGVVTVKALEIKPPKS